MSSNLSIHVENTINTSIETVFDFLMHPQKHPGIMPGLTEFRNIPKDLREGEKFDFTYHMYGVNLNGTWTITKHHYPDSYEGQTTGDIISSWKYVLTMAHGCTHIALDITYDPPQSVLARLQQGIVRRLNEKAAERFLDNIKLILEPIS